MKSTPNLGRLTQTMTQLFKDIYHSTEDGFGAAEDVEYMSRLLVRLHINRRWHSFCNSLVV
jgi:hypothetical protein